MCAYIIDAASSSQDSELHNSGDWKRTHTLKDGSDVVVGLLDRNSEEELSLLHSWMEAECRSGTYPQNTPLSRDQFVSYYCSHTVLVARNEKTGAVLGSVYIKPNYPGKCSHICNGGFLVRPESRGKGVGKALAVSFEQAAKVIGYRAIVFNLVFADNESSVHIWKNSGYTQIGKVPNAKATDSGEYIDAYIFYKALV
mmetsp:Transcript_10596/g.12165  ORF Transcript_10596/g.12165 Transcript_10596/m.12165 type:complete len:198 (+) Transcript_10596:132-725(+)